MEWTQATGAGDFLAERIDTPWRGTIHDVVPRGYPTATQVLHPGTRDRPVDGEWPPVGADVDRWDAFLAGRPQIDEQPVGWTEAAAALGSTATAPTSWDDVVAPGGGTPGDDPRDAAGWRYSPPALGGPPPAVLAVLARVLARHTGTPDDGFVAVWEGWGGLVGHVGDAPARTFLAVEDPETERRHNQMLQASIKDRFTGIFRRRTWQPGILPDDVSRGPRLELPDRAYVLFRGGVTELAVQDWALRAPWRDREAEAHGFPPSAEPPNLLWPADRSWVVGADVDWSFSVVVGSAALQADLLADPDLETVPLPPDARLG